jgi:hypothetical protein
MALSPVLSERVKPQVKKYALWEDGRIFILNPLTKGGILTLLQEREITAQCVLSDSEMYIIDLLFKLYPAYSPIEELLAILKDKPVAACLEMLSEAADSSNYGDYAPLTRCVCTAVSACRKHLRAFGIDIKAIDKIGYELFIPKRQQKPYVSRSGRSQGEIARANV